MITNTDTNTFVKYTTYLYMSIFFSESNNYLKNNKTTKQQNKTKNNAF